MKVYVTRKIPDRGIRLLKENNIEVIINPEDRQPTAEEIIKNASDCDGIITLLSDKINREIIDKLPKLKIIANYAVGINNIDFEYARSKGIVVGNTPDVLTETTAELGFALMMAVARKIPQSHEFTKKGKFKGWEPELFCGYDLYKKTLGIVGLGRIGQAVALRGRGFCMNILYKSRKPNFEAEKNTGAEYAELDELAQKSDFIILCCPLTSETRHMIDRSFIEKMKNNAIIVNIARGPVVDEQTLIEFLENKKIAGAGFDVYENEPEVPEKLRELDNVVILPHIGSASYETRAKMSEICALNTIEVLKDNGGQVSGFHIPKT
ncbi:MAG: 2-hydroxyacid dehydrogenase [Candidatus Muiribacteriota bacterium]